MSAFSAILEAIKLGVAKGTPEVKTLLKDFAGKEGATEAESSVEHTAEEIPHTAPETPHLDAAASHAESAPKSQSTPAPETPKAEVKAGPKTLVGKVWQWVNPFNVVRPKVGGTVDTFIKDHLGNGLVGGFASWSTRSAIFGATTVMAAGAVVTGVGVAWSYIGEPVSNFGAKILHYVGIGREGLSAVNSFADGKNDEGVAQTAGGIGNEVVYDTFKYLGLGDFYALLAKWVMALFHLDIGKMIGHFIGGNPEAALILDQKDAVQLASAKQQLTNFGLSKDIANNPATVNQLDSDTVKAYQRFLTEKESYRGPVDGKITSEFSMALAHAAQVHPDIIPPAVMSAINGKVNGEFASIYQSVIGKSPITGETPNAQQIAAQLKKQYPSMGREQIIANTRAVIEQSAAQNAQSTTLIEALLRDAGAYHGPAARSFADIKGALIAYQRQNGLREIGIFGPATFEALLSTASIKSPDIANILANNANIFSGNAGVMGWAMKGHEYQSLVDTIMGDATLRAAKGTGVQASQGAAVPSAEAGTATTPRTTVSTTTPTHASGMTTLDWVVGGAQLATSWIPVVGPAVDGAGALIQRVGDGVFSDKTSTELNRDFAVNGAVFGASFVPLGGEAGILAKIALNTGKLAGAHSATGVLYDATVGGDEKNTVAPANTPPVQVAETQVPKREHS